MTTTATWATVASPSLPQGSLPTARQSPRCLGRAPSLSWFSRSVSRLQRLQPWRRRYRAAPHRHLRTISGRRLRSTLITSADDLSSVCRTPPRADLTLTAAGAFCPGGTSPGDCCPKPRRGRPQLSGSGVIVNLAPGIPPLPAMAGASLLRADMDTGQILVARAPHAPQLLPAP